MNQPHPPSYHFDQDLREVPDNVDEWSSFVDQQKTQLENENLAANKLPLLENLGMSQRILRRLDEAEASLKKALELSRGPSSLSHVIQNLIRLAHVHQWKHEFDKTQALFDQAQALISEFPVSEGLRASYHQHLGKLYFDQQQFSKAQVEFVAALTIREKIAAPVDQIQNSKVSLNAALKRMQLDD